VRVFEGTRAAALRDVAGGVEVFAAGGRVRARRVLLATSAFPPLLRAIRRYVVRVYDYALVTEPLDAAQREAIGWRRRQGLSDGANQFHYYRLTPDDRILFGGYDAVYR
jgi:glycine/D-amino acid oxidase-like deaminating enzyme